jgi:hypothetical protein
MQPHRHVHKPLPSRATFLTHLFKKAVIAISVVAASLFMGACGYHFTENLGWLDSTLNASMILAGMGPVSDLKTSGGKLFAIFYALFSGVVFITLAAVLFAPVLHRFLHRFHMELENDDDSPGGKGPATAEGTARTPAKEP